MSAAKRHAIATRSRVVIETLARLFPRCFHVHERQRRPLKLHIHVDLIEACATAGAVSEIDLRNALGSYTRNRAYLRRCAKPGAKRIGLHGEVCGTVTAAEAAFARSFAPAKNEAPNGAKPAGTSKELKHHDDHASQRLEQASLHR